MCPSQPLPPWRILPASVRGTSHLRAGLPCQDALRWTTLPNQQAAIAVADGAGSALFSEAGASLAVTKALEGLTTGLAGQVPEPTNEAWETVLRKIFADTRAALLTAAAEKSVAPRELATTLLLAFISPDFVAAAQVGDGAVVAGQNLDDLTALTLPPTSEYLNETTFLTSDEALACLQIRIRRKSTRCAGVFSDGLQLLALKLPEGKPHPGFFRPLYQFLDQATDLDAAGDQLRAFLQSPRITARTDDDLTLCLARLPDEAGKSAPARPASPGPPN